MRNDTHGHVKLFCCTCAVRMLGFNLLFLLTRPVHLLHCAGHCLPANVWEWEDTMARSLALHVRELRVLSPQHLSSPKSPLPHLATCRHLRSLTLCHVAAPALDDALHSLEALTTLNVTVYWEMAQTGWLDFVAHLTKLQVSRANVATTSSANAGTQIYQNSDDYMMWR